MQNDFLERMKPIFAFSATASIIIGVLACFLGGFLIREVYLGELYTIRSLETGFNSAIAGIALGIRGIFSTRRVQGIIGVIISGTALILTLIAYILFRFL